MANLLAISNFALSATKRGTTEKIVEALGRVELPTDGLGNF
jgi:hypothetical protein